MNTDKINKIREKCIEANPEIVELKFGCEMNNNDIFLYEKSDSNGEQNFYFLRNDRNPVMSKTYSAPANIDFYRNKIIGRPITLADVLLALKENFEQIYVDPTGEIYVNAPKSYVGDVRIERIKLGLFWHLKETLENQPEETIDFIISLIDKK